MFTLHGTEKESTIELPVMGHGLSPLLPQKISFLEESEGLPSLFLQPIPGITGQAAESAGSRQEGGSCFISEQLQLIP